MDRRAFAYIRPYWRRLAGVLAISLVSTALSLYLPYLTKSLVDDALVGRSLAALQRIVAIFVVAGAAGFALTVVSGLLYTRVSAEILFDMRRELYEHVPASVGGSLVGNVGSQGDSFVIVSARVGQASMHKPQKMHRR